MKKLNIFNKSFAVGILLILGVMLAISPAGTRTPDYFSSEEITGLITSKSNFVSAEDIARMIIDKSPDLLLVDIRTPAEYDQYHIDGSFNIPLDKLFEDESQDILLSDMTIVLYSNGSTNAAQVWLMLQQRGIQTYVMQGGMNYWAKAILNPTPPGDLVADSEILLYQFRKGASAYFNGGGIVSSRAANTGGAKGVMKPLPKKKKKKGGACF
ncbi:MAG: rhodanese-like domain-containing protein [bacterium]|nr:rhodanese-like domain-containing protein [bacterium]